VRQALGSREYSYGSASPNAQIPSESSRHQPGRQPVETATHVVKLVNEVNLLPIGGEW
jgi:hypothetical protein